MNRTTIKPMAAFLALFLAAAVPGRAAEDAMEFLREKEGSRPNTVTLNYRQVRLERILSDMEKQRPGVNVKVKAPTFQEEQELLMTPVTMGPLSGVSWDTAIRYIADRMGLVADRTQLGDGVLYLEKIARFTDTFDGVRLGEAVRQIAKRGNANVIFSPKVGTDAPVHLSFTDVPWREALESLLKAHDCTILNDADGRIMRIATRGEADIQFETRSRPLRYVQPEGPHFQPEIVKDDHQSFVNRKGATTTDVGRSLIAVLGQVKSELASVTYESRTNTLIIRDTPIKIEEMLKIVDQIDLPPQQVLVETRLMTVEENPTFRLGVKWGQDGETYEGLNNIGVTSGPSWTTSWPWAASSGWGNLGNVLRPATPATPHPIPGGTATSGGSNYSLGMMSMESLSFVLQAAKYDDSVKITQAPQILVLDNEEASVFIGNVRNYALSESTVNEGIISTSINEKEILVGVQLLVIPHVCRGTDQVIIEVIPKQTDNPIISSVNSGGGGYVDIPTSMGVKTVHTKMMLHSGETGVIAGLFRDELTEQSRKVPGLYKIPVLGKLFEHKTRDAIKHNTMILVTPTIVPPKHSEEFDRDVESFRNSLAVNLR